MVLVCDFGVGWGGGGNHYQPDRAASRIVGLSLLLDVRCAIHDYRGTDLQLPGAAQSRHYWLCTFSRATDHDGGSNWRRIDAAAGRHFCGIHRAEWSGGCLCGSLLGKESNRKPEPEIPRLIFYELRAARTNASANPPRINRRHARFLFCGGCAESPSNELNRGFGRRRRQPRRLLESRRQVVSES